MKTYIITCDRQVNNSMKVYDYFFKKYWPSGKFIMLGYEQPKQKSDLIKFVSLGKDLGANKLNQQLYEYFLNLKDSQFIFTADDQPILKQVNVDLINYTEELLKNNNIIGRVGISEDNSSRPHKVISNISEDIILIENTNTTNVSTYKLSGTWSAWNREYFLLYMNRYENLWDWESKGSIESNKDDFKVMGYKPAPLLHSHLRRGGELHPNWNIGCSHYYKYDMKLEDQLKIRSIYGL